MNFFAGNNGVFFVGERFIEKWHQVYISFLT